MPKARKFERLRKRLREYDIDQPYLAELLGCSQSHVSGCLTGRTEWTLSEVYAVAKICGIPRAEILYFFPLGGVDREEESPDTTQLFAYSLARMMSEYINASKQGGVA